MLSSANGTQSFSTRFNGAATFPSRMQPGDRSLASQSSRLQWGRDVSVADATSSTSGGLVPWSFNGAATFPSRMRTTREPPDRPYSASMGPRRFRRGCARRIVARERHLRELQWGRDVSVADASLLPLCYLKLKRFNGAATFPSRMRCPDRNSDRLHKASMGPRRFRRGCHVRECCLC